MANEEIKCPIWGTPAKRLDGEKSGEKMIFDSRRAGGRYELTGSAKAMLSNLAETDKPKLTTWIVDHIRLGDASPVVTSTVLGQIKNFEPLAVRERRNRLVRYMETRVRRIGESIQVAGQVTEILNRNLREMLAWTESYQDNELRYLIDSCVSEGWIEKVGSVGDGIVLTVTGYEYLDRLDQAIPTASQAFVAMWFDGSMNEAYDKGFAPAIGDAGFKPLKIDLKEHVNKIDDEIIAEIRRSRFVVADFTARLSEQEGDEIYEARGGVYFEAGFALGLKIPVIWTCREDMISHVHFDTRQFNHIAWSTPDELYEKLLNRIGAVIGVGPLKSRI